MIQGVDGQNCVVSLDNPDERSDALFCLQQTCDAQVTFVFPGLSQGVARSALSVWLALLENRCGLGPTRIAM